MPDDSLTIEVYKQLRAEIAATNKQVAQATHNTERAEYTDGIPAYLYADLPTTGLSDGTSYITLAWVTNGRKTGEGVGAGTGVLAIWQQSAGDWLRVGDYTSVVI